MKMSSIFTWGGRSMLSVSNLHAGYGRTAVLSGVDLHVGAGEIVAVLGGNGGGKTTPPGPIMGPLAAWEGRVIRDWPGGPTPWPAHGQAPARPAPPPPCRPSCCT